MLPSIKIPRILGILNLSPDSFSDGGLYSDPKAALARARYLQEEGAFAIDIGAVSSNPEAAPVDSETELRRLLEVALPLAEEGFAISVDSFNPEVQRAILLEKGLWPLPGSHLPDLLPASIQGTEESTEVGKKAKATIAPKKFQYSKNESREEKKGSATGGLFFLNDIQGFPDPSLYPVLEKSSCSLVVMHSIQGRGIATKERWQGKGRIVDHILRFFEKRVAVLRKAGISEKRIILDPGMGFFLGSDPRHSFEALAAIPRFKEAFGLEILISVSRKSFLGAVTERDVSERSFATVAAELAASLLGADYIRTHEPGALRDSLVVWGHILHAERGGGA